MSFIKDQATIDRELFGKITSGSNFIFGENKEWINKFVARAPYRFQYPVQVLHVAVDPAAGAESSDYVIGTMTYENNNKVVSFTNPYNSQSSYAQNTE